MFEIYKNIWIILNAHERKRFIYLLMLMIIVTFFEVIGIGSIMPFLSVLGNPETIETNSYLKLVYDTLGFENQKSFLIFLGGFAFFMLLASAGVRSLGTYASLRFSHMRRHSIGQRLLKKYLQQSYSFFLSRSSNEISKTILSETDVAIGQAISPAITLITSSILTIFLVGFLIMLDPILALILACTFGGFYGIIYILIRKYISKLGTERLKANSKRFQTASEIIGGIKELKVLGREKIYFNSFQDASYRFSHYTSLSRIFSIIPQFLIEVLAFGALLVMALYALAKGSGDIGTLLPTLGLYALGTLKLKPAINNIYSSLSTIKFGAPAIENIIKDFKEIDDISVNIKNNEKRLELKNTLEIKDICFKYPNTSQLALKNINILIEANTTVGIIGTTGAGKSTLVDLILGLVYPSSGTVLIDTIRLEQSTRRQWQNSIGYVPQSIFLADDTISSNIAFGIDKDLINMDQVKKVAEMVQVGEFISSLEEGYETIIGERGVRLSGGQRQRLGIARALYHDPELLVLDEATSALDNKTEAEVMKAIDGMNGSKTIIMIAHRLSTLDRCNTIIKLESGEIIETTNR